MSRARGFTMIEVVIALALLSLVMVATMAALRTFGNTKATLGQVTDRVGEVRLVSQFLRNSIGGSLPVARVGYSEDSFQTGDNYGTYFWGNPHELMWVAPMVAGADVGGAFLMRLVHVDRQLQLKWQSYQRIVENVSWGEAQSHVLLAEVDEFEIGYLAEARGEWLGNWSGAQVNPVAVRLRIKSRDRFWPELVIPLDASELNQL